MLDCSDCLIRDWSELGIDNTHTAEVACAGIEALYINAKIRNRLLSFPIGAAAATESFLSMLATLEIEDPEAPCLAAIREILDDWAANVSKVRGQIIRADAESGNNRVGTA